MKEQLLHLERADLCQDADINRRETVKHYVINYVNVFCILSKAPFYSCVTLPARDFPHIYKLCFLSPR